MTEWSMYYQNPSYFKSTRMFLLDPDMRECCIKWMGLHDGMKVLDVGCGSGAFTEYLSQGVKGCTFHGVDLDETLIAFANDTFSSRTDNKFEFFTGDALQLNIPSNTYDLVVSHTFLTNIRTPLKALNEMKRVARSGANIVSVTSQSFQNIPMHPGVYPPDQQEAAKEYFEVHEKVIQLYFQVKPFTHFIEGAEPTIVPHLFTKCGLLNIQMHGIGRGFSLSDSRFSEEMKRTYICEEYNASLQKFQNYLKLPEFKALIDESLEKKYPKILQQRRNQLLENIGENYIWEWYGGSSMMIVGTKAADLSVLSQLFGGTPK